MGLEYLNKRKFDSGYYTMLCEPTLGTVSMTSGAHNDVRAEGKGRSVQRPRTRLKFENIFTVVPLLSSACTQMCTNTCTKTSQRTRKSTRTLFVVKQRKETVLYKYVVNPVASQPERGDLWGVSTHGKNSPFGFLELMTAGKHILRPLWILFCVLQ